MKAAEAAGKLVAKRDVAFGDVDASFAKADLVVRERFTVCPQTAVPMEPRGLLAEFDPGRRLLTMWPTKVPYFNRAVLSAMLGLPEGQIHFIEPDVGGGFGARGEFYPEISSFPSPRWRRDARSRASAKSAAQRKPSWFIACSSSGDTRFMRIREL